MEYTILAFIALIFYGMTFALCIMILDQYKKAKIAKRLAEQVERQRIEAQEQARLSSENNKDSQFEFIPEAWTQEHKEQYEEYEPYIEISFNGKPLISVNGNYKSGMIKKAMESKLVSKQGKMKVFEEC